jgi:hypothetical protein
MKTWRTIRSLFNDADEDLRERIIATYPILLAINVGAWVWAGRGTLHFQLDHIDSRLQVASL